MNDELSKYNYLEGYKTVQNYYSCWNCVHYWPDFCEKFGIDIAISTYSSCIYCKIFDNKFDTIISPDKDSMLMVVY